MFRVDRGSWVPDYILALELILNWNERNFGTQNGGRVQPTHVETQDGSSQTSKLLLYLYWKGKGFFAMARKRLAPQMEGGLKFYRREGQCEFQNLFHSSVEGPLTCLQFLIQTHSARLKLKDSALGK